MDPWVGNAFLTAGTGVTLTKPDTVTGGTTIEATGGISGGTTNTIPKFGSPTTLVDSGATETAGEFTYTTPTNHYGFTHTDGTVVISTYVDSLITTKGWIGTYSDHPLVLMTDTTERLTLSSDGEIEYRNDTVWRGDSDRPFFLMQPHENKGFVQKTPVGDSEDIEVGTASDINGGRIGTFTESNLTIIANDTAGAGLTSDQEFWVGDITGDGSAIFTVKTVTQGSIPMPRMATTDRDAIATPAEGLCVYNMTTHKLNFYDGSAWRVVTST